jgi:hypothetical protein
VVPARYRFRPRFRALAWSAALVGGGLFGAAMGFGLTGASLIFALVAGGVGVGLGGLYLRSPAWRIEITVDDEALEVVASGARRFRLRWAEIERVVASPETKTCFVDGGSPDRSLLVPGPGAQAPYEIEDRQGLFDTILARAPAACIEEVPLLRGAAAAPRRDREAPAGEGGPDANGDADARNEPAGDAPEDGGAPSEEESR